MPLIPIKDAAQRLGVVEATVRRRIRHGDLQAQKVTRPQGFTWLVELPEEELTRDPVSEDPSDKTEVSFQESSGELQLLREMVELLKSELQVRDVQIAAQNNQIGQLHVLLQQAQAALPAPKESHHSWWRFWQR